MKCLSNGMTIQYHRDGIFFSLKLKMSIVTKLVKDSCNLDTTPATASIHFHGTNITLKQYTSKYNQGEKFFRSGLVSNKPGT